MTATSDGKYADYVEHPRYGRGPRYTGFNYDEYEGEDEAPRYVSSSTDGIPYTSIRADPARQATTANHVTHYFDIECRCRDCGRPFLFFAEEQKYWYEELRFKRPALCVRCIECRKKRQMVVRYQQLSRRTDRTDQEKLDLAECCLTLIEREQFTHKQISHVRELLNSLSEEADRSLQDQAQQLIGRIRSLER